MALICHGTVQRKHCSPWYCSRVISFLCLGVHWFG
uniref:Uncharacterized protein n=1 Tax=Arundo donax TaxID=35708 RepID=A0A0A9B9S4_ARUDO